MTNEHDSYIYVGMSKRGKRIFDDIFIRNLDIETVLREAYKGFYDGDMGIPLPDDLIASGTPYPKEN